MTALAEALADIEGLQESPFVLSNPIPPVAEVIPGAIDFDETMGRGMDSFSATVRVSVGTSQDIGAQKKLLSFRAPAGPTSVKEALEADKTLGDLVHYVHVTNVGAVRQFRRPDGDVVLGCDFSLDINTKGDET